MTGNIVEVDVFFEHRSCVLEEDVSFSAESPDAPLKRRIIGITEGRHNGINFSAEEIEKGVATTLALAEREGRKTVAPVVMDHDDSLLSLIGAAYSIEAKKITAKNAEGKDTEVMAAIGDIRFDANTPALKEVAARIRNHPDLVFNSMRIRGKLGDDMSMKDFFFVHFSTVLDPADRNARATEQFSRRRDAPLNNDPGNAPNMTGQEPTTPSADVMARLQAIEAKSLAQETEIQTLRTDLAAATARAAAAELAPMRDALLAATPSLTQEFVATLSKDQLVALKADADARLAQEARDAILAAKKGYSKDFLATLTLPQLTALKADVGLQQAGGTTKTGKGSGATGTQQLTAEQKSDAFFGKVDSGAFIMPPEADL